MSGDFPIEHAWFHIEDEAALPTPSLVLYRERMDHNLQLMVQLAGGAARLRPHVKTHKLAPLVTEQVSLGITKFKCSTIAEAEMTAAAGGQDILLAMPCVGANAHRLAHLAQRFPEIRFSTLADDEETICQLASAAQQARVDLGVYLDVDCGMGRTGIYPGHQAGLLARVIKETPRLAFAGLHAYDGHIHATSLEDRERLCTEAFAPVLALQAELNGAGILVKELVAGGSPTFVMHARHQDRTLSPGTTVLWDFGYGDRFPDLPFLPAAVLLTRVVSKPGTDRITLDLGHKAVASENPHPRVRFEELPEMEVMMQSEEHLVLRVEQRERFLIGEILHGIPRHICPTVALHGEVFVVTGGKVVDTWTVTARNRRITV
jgi:D-serine deaminase-like pyridoxal phosphate-dependent protein